MKRMIGVCPGCGKPFKIEQAVSGEIVYCEDVCINPADMPTGERMMPDQATKLYVDGNMREMKRQDYIKMHGFDPEPVMQAVNKWREGQARKWAISQGKSPEEVDEWMRKVAAGKA
ncbi:MAG: hypothetical protein LUO89_14495 [Methanothrix sp.]|nr:hypothetical protein [Methanothrix sp.]